MDENFNNNSTLLLQDSTKQAAFVNTNAPRVITQVVVSTLSFIASFIVAASVARRFKTQNNGDETRSGLTKNSYRRIIFGLCLADMLLSFSLAIGPLAIPKHPVFSPWGRGNDTSCSFAGMLLNAGSIMSPMYTTFLCFFYCCKTGKKKMTDPQFLAKEVLIHRYICLFTLLFVVVTQALGTTNPAPSGANCGPVLSPTGCNAHPEIFGECENPELTTGVMFVIFAIFVICLSLIIAFMACIIFHVCSRNKKYRILSGYPSTPQTNPRQQEGEVAVTLRNNILKQRAERLRILYLRTTMTQALLFVGVFIVCNAGYVYISSFGMLLGKLVIKDMSPVIYYLITILYPSTGIINILVFTRPAIKFLRQLQPEYCWFHAFYLVLQNGGEVPNDRTLRDSEESEHQEPPEQIENIPLGVEDRRLQPHELANEIFNDIDANYSSNDNLGILSNNEYGESLPSVISSLELYPRIHYNKVRVPGFRNEA
ncbi:predicted protein [Chaetoceros tenuissimus]|uniref:G-protein coupled receptors family 1 profile domain-containing protein n=1 Tax=Chaetoceros tenuissimus TaxID=426638 RepID=A0AAD3HAC5_9STRA|nr:predicted protein [Chaetoceros tenuissimus]